MEATEGGFRQLRLQHGERRIRRYDRDGRSRAEQIHPLGLQNAGSIVSLILTTEAMVDELHKEDKPVLPAGGMDDYNSR